MTGMKDLALVALGGGVGAVARYLVGGALLHWSAQERFPLSTFIVNVLGCLAIGLVAGLVERQQLLSSEIRLLLMTGVLGGFTTFSAFGLEAIQLVRRGEWWIAGLYAGGSVVAGIAAVWLGMRIADVLSR